MQVVWKEMMTTSGTQEEGGQLADIQVVLIAWWLAEALNIVSNCQQVDEAKLPTYERLRIGQSQWLPAWTSQMKSVQLTDVVRFLGDHSSQATSTVSCLNSQLSFSSDRQITLLSEKAIQASCSSSTGIAMVLVVPPSVTLVLSLQLKESNLELALTFKGLSASRLIT